MMFSAVFRLAGRQILPAGLNRTQSYDIDEVGIPALLADGFPHK